MDKNSLSIFGWIIVVLIFVGSIIALLPSFGDYISNSLFDSAGSLMDRAEIDRPISVSINESYYGSGSLLRKEYFAKELVEFDVQEFVGYIYNGAVVTAEDGQTVNLDKNLKSFYLGDENVLIDLKFSGIKSSHDISENQDSSSSLTIYENNTAVIAGYTSPSCNAINKIDVSDIDVVYITNTVPSISDLLFINFSSLNKIVVKASPESISIPLSSLPSGFDVNNVIYEY